MHILGTSPVSISSLLTVPYVRVASSALTITIILQDCPRDSSLLMIQRPWSPFQECSHLKRKRKSAQGVRKQCFSNLTISPQVSTDRASHRPHAGSPCVGPHVQLAADVPHGRRRGRHRRGARGRHTLSHTAEVLRLQFLDGLHQLSVHGMDESSFLNIR